MCFKNIGKFLSEIMTIIRYKYGVTYLGIGLCLLICFWFIKTEILWCLGWAAFGVGCGLINSRYDDINKGKEEKDIKKNKGGDMHYIFYFSFVGFLATLAALTMNEDSSIKFYAVSALVAIVVGFTGDKLVDKIFEMRK